MNNLIYIIELTAQKWLPYIISSSIQLTILFFIIFSLSLISKKQSARFIYLLWFIGLIKILIPPTITLPDFLGTSKLLLQQRIPIISMPAINIVTNELHTLSYKSYLFLGWVLISVFLLTFWILKNLKFKSHINRSVKLITNDRNLNSFIKNDKVEFYVGPNITIPFTKGLIKPKIYLPEKALNWSKAELKAIILHEYAHIQRKDILVIGLQNLVQIFYFFHPFVWFANIQLTRFREKACDDYAIQKMQGNTIEYSKFLLKSIDSAVNWQALPSMGNYFHQSRKFLINRFEYILNRREDIANRLSFFQRGIIVALFGLAIVFSCENKNFDNALSTPGSLDNISMTELQSGLSVSQKSDCDVPPMPAGGFTAINDLLSLPKFSQKAGIVLNLLIDENGNPNNNEIKLQPDYDYSLNKELKASLYLFEKTVAALYEIKWQPGMENGQRVSSWITIPVKYVLDINVDKIDFSSSKLLPPPPPPVENSQSEQFIETAYDIPPKPVGGFSEIQKGLVYPAIARKAGIEGTVLVQAHINEMGEIDETKILKSLGENNGCNESAIQAIKSVKWEPARKNGKAIPVQISIPIRFKLR